MRYKPSFIIYSLDSPGDPYILNYALTGTFDDPDWQGHQGLKGVYKGVSELSFSAPLGHLHRVRHAAACRQQESILIVENGSAYLEWVATSNRVYLGEWTQIPKIHAMELDAYTEYNGNYYAATGV